MNNITYTDGMVCPICRRPIHSNEECVCVIVLPINDGAKKMVHKECFDNLSESMKYNF